MSRHCPQPDSVSNPCRCRVLATPRVFSAVSSARAWKHVAMIFAVLTLVCGNVWGTVVSFSATNLNAPVGRTIGSISLSTSNMTYTNSNGLTASSASQAFTLTASGGATISQVLITSTTGSRYSAGNITNCTSCTREGNVYTCTISPATSSVTCTNTGGGLKITRIDVTYSGGTSTKRIYMKCGDTWCSSTPRFFAHSWGSAENDLELYAVGGCDPAVYYADIPSGNTGVTFTRQNSSSTGLLWSGSNFWNQSEDITISTNNLFTCTGWNNSKGTFSGSVAALSVTYNANGATGSAPTDANSYGYGATVTVLGKNTLTKADNMFIGWNTEDDGTGTWYAPGETFTIECANVTLYAQWATELDLKYVWKVTGKFCDDQSGDNVASINMIPTNDYFTLSGTGVTQSSANSLNVDKTVGNNFLLTAKSGYQIKSICFYGKIEDASVYKTTDGSDWTGTIASTNTSGDAHYTFSNINATHFGIKLSGTKGIWIRNMVITIAPAAAACGATQPGTISKGTLSGCTMRLTASGSPASNNTWYWQASSTGTSTSESGATKDVTAAGTYYIRSYCSTGSGCWSDARSVVVSASDLTPAAPSALAAASPTAKGVTLTVTDAANTNDYEFYVNTSSSAPGGSTPATHSSNTKSITITNLYAGTTFYAWARAKCGSNKSTWTALGDGGNFTTSTVTVTHTLTNVTKTSGATTAGGSDYTAEFAAVSGYSMPTPTVTIGGNAATSGTDYTWNAGTGTITIPANKINGNIAITLNSVPSAPSSVAITGNWLYFAGETIELTATPTGGNGPVTYQWYKGGKENGNAIEGATNATYTKATCAFEDAGSYYCKVTCGGSQSSWGQNGDAYEVKIPRLYVKTGRNDGVKSDFGNVDFTRATASTATASIVLGSNWDYCFNIADGCGHYYGNAGTMQYNNTGWITNDPNKDCGLRTTNGAAYVFTIDYSNWSQLRTTITFPVANQAADKVIYFDNNDRKWSTLHYRIGRVDNTQATAMTKVPGTDNLYKVTTPAYNNFMGWHIANNAGWTGSNSIYRTYTNCDEYSITYATAHEGGAVTESAVTVTPTTSRGNGSDVGINDNCEFYNYTITNGMKTQNVSITEPSNGTLTVNYVDVNGDGQAFNSGNRDLAHTCIIIVTAVPSTGYEPATVSINGASHGNRDPYTITGTTVVAATFTAKTYNITLDRNGASSGSESVTMTYNSSSHTAITAPEKAGYTFDGWYDSETDDNGSGNLVMNASGVLQENVTGFTGADGIWTKDATCTLYAKWTAAASLTALECNTLYKVEDMVASSITSITGTEQYAAGLSSNTKFEVLGTGSSNATGGPMGAKNDGATISETAFTNSLYFKGTGNKSGEIPTSRGIKFITPSAGTLDIYVKGPGSINIVKEGGTGSAIGAGDSNAKVSVEVTAGTYYLYATAGSRTLFGIKLNCCSDPVINEGTTKTSFAGGSWPQNSGHTITITATGADSYEWYRNTSATDAGATKLSETSNTLDITAGVAAGTYFYKAIAKSGACSSSTEWGLCGAMTITAVTYSITYNCNGAESGCPSNVAAATNLPNPLPSAPTKDGYDFVGWYTDSEKTVAAVAGAVLTANTTLYAKWTEEVASSCITITHFSSNNNSSDGKPDSFSKYLYGYKGSVSAENALTLTSNNANTAGQNSNVELRLDNSATLRIYANNITNATPGSFGDVVSVSFDAKLYKSGSTSRTQPYTIKVGGTSVGSGSVVGLASDGYQHVSTGTFAAKDGYVDIVLDNTGSSNTNLYIDNIEICQLPCTDAGLSYASTTVNKADGDAGFTNPLTNPHGVTVSYKSSNPEVATVNGTTGAVSIVGIGATVITATSVRQKVSETAYCADEATYMLCVTATASCQLLAYGIQNAAHNDIPGVLGTITNTGAGAADSYVKLTADDKYFSVKAKSGNFAAGDKVSVRVYNKDSSNPQTLGFKIKSTSHTAEIAKKSKGVVEYTLVAGDIESDGTIRIKRSSSNDRYDAIWVERCEACTMPTVTTHPTAASYNQGASATALTAVFDGQGKELSYQWYSNDEADNTTGSIIAGATSTSYTPSTELVGTKYYYCVGKTACGSVATNVATITINDTHAAPTADWTGTTATPIHGGRGFDVVVAAKNAAGNAVWDGTLDATMLTASTGIDIHDIVVNNTAKTITAKYDVTPAVTNPIIFSLTLPATDTHKSATLTHTLSDISLCAGGAEEFYWSANVSSPLTANTAAKLVSKTTDTEIELSGTTSAASSTRSTDKATGIVDGTTYSFLSSDPHHTYIKLSSGEEFHFTTTITATISVQFTTRSGDESGIEIYKTSKSGTLIASKLVTGKGDKFQTLTTGSVDAGTYYVVAKNKEINVGEILVVQGSGSAGTYTPALAWSNDQEDGAMVEKNEDAADFSITATRSNSDAEASLGALTYNSSYPSVATVNETTGQVHIADNIDFGGATYKETTITATLAASGCYKRAQITYVLRVKKDICTEAAGTVRIKTDNGCEGQVLTVTGFETGATGFQWYRNGEEIAEATSQDYTATASGSYSVVTRKTCDVASSNSVEVTIETATATKIVDEWYVKNGRRTPDIALVKTTNATGFTVSPTSIGGCTFELKDDGIIYLHGTQSNGTAPSGMSAGNQEVTITATACVNASPVTITIHQQVETPKPSIAFVVDGTKNGKVTDVNTSHTTSRGLYATDLSAEFNLTACNVYWTTNEQMLRQYYSQFDAVVITDDPNTQEYPGGRAEKESATLGYVNAMGTLIDVRPVLTMEAYVSRLANWDCVKGKPLSPDPREYVLKLQCKEHAIYADLTEDGSLVRQESVDGVDYWYVTMVDKTLSPYAGSTETAEKLPALQGFDGKTNAGMLGIGTIADEALQGGIERQKEPAARMMVLGVNSKAMDALTAPGKHVIINAIKYLLQTDMESLEDCSNYFKGGTAGHERDWHTATNWTSGKVPDPTVRARILVPCEITGVAKAASIDIAVGGRTTRYQSGTRDCEGRLTINADGALIVGGEIHRIESAPNFGVDNLKPTETSDLTVLADADNNGALIFDNPDGTTNATVHFYSKAYTNIVDGKKKKHWQYFGIPIHEAPIPEFFYGAYTYVWEEQNSAWARRREGSTLYEWDALAVSYGVVMDEQPTYVLYGELTSTQNHTASLTYDGIDGDKGYNLIGNSWTAPIQIANFEDADFGANVEKTVYIHNTGRQEQAGGYTPAENTSNTPGQWISVAINAPAVPGYEGVKVIPAMQAFEVHATSASTLTLNYDRLVRGVTPTELNTPMRAPRRVSSMEDVDPKTVRMLKVQVADQKTQTSAYIFLHDGFSEMYDNGWDARYSEGNGESAVLYVATPDGNMAMAALPDADGAVLGFAPGQENTYTFSFKYTGDEVLYLNDMQEETSTQINEENTYTFTYSENDMVGRFFISPQPFGVPAITTGNEHIGDEAKPHKFIKDEKIYILVHGVLYDATGKVVK